MNILQLATAMRQAQNPMQLFTQAARQTPQGMQVLKLMEGKTPEQFRATLENMARERGTTLDNVIASLGLNR